ncbi:hypothetical protein BZG35_00645 [Brevundimonas sp. LM2]|uniref:alpha/beta hydrolase family protein n=1 Tax=Brevundimonas sp. LM2 TaxID=1938605 RepID=UPI0009839E2A|nr:alpha/beta hydrolase [Brevundimonas sp. LM2]AQR60326.1 hypothetical protein BZG35_00645 [Brevundimonas sp. LM2]
MTFASRLAGLLAAVLWLTAPAVSWAQADPAPAVAPLGDRTLKAADGRDIPVFVWTAPEEQGVIVFGHGLGGEPQAYAALLSQWAEAGFTVIAPLHVDSRRHPGGGRVGGGQALATRVADLVAVRALVQAEHPDRPLVMAGHSFGSLLALIQGGAVTAMGPMGDPLVRAIVALSTAGDLPGLITPETYAGLAAPLLMITGDADTVPTYAPDWHAHRSPYDRSPSGDRMLVIFEGGDHNLVRDGTEAQRELVRTITLDFMRAHALGNGEAAARLATLVAPAGVQIERR